MMNACYIFKIVSVPESNCTNSSSAHLCFMSLTALITVSWKDLDIKTRSSS